MTAAQQNRGQAGAGGSRAAATLYRDVSGYEAFSAGEEGAAHVMAHRMLDQGRYELGHRLLGEWLEGREGSGSQWTHLQWHMAVFELALGHWESAFARFQEHILPAAASTDEALTDAPSLLWRLWLAAPHRAGLPWAPIRSRALRHLRRTGQPYVELHNLLALAGAGDVESLDRWLRGRNLARGSRKERLLARMAAGLRAFAAGAYEQAAATLAGVASRMTEVGGSRAQNDLFEELERTARSMAAEGRTLLSLAEAA